MTPLEFENSTESWRDVPLQRLSQLNWNSVGQTSLRSLLPEEIELVKGAHAFVFVDGCYQPESFDPSLASERSRCFSVIETKQDSESASTGRDDLNWSRIDGNTPAPLFHLEVKSRPSKPVVLLSVSSTLAGVQTLRIHIEINKSVEVSIAEIHLGAEQRTQLPSLCLSLAEDAQVQHLRYSGGPAGQAHLGRVWVLQNRSSGYRTLMMNKGSVFSRTEFVNELCESGARSEFLGLTWAQEKDFTNFFSTITHKVGHCESAQLAKALAGGLSKTLFLGQVKIAEGASGARSEQLNKNLLLSLEAEVNSRPVLVISNDDVKATHGSTTGRLDREELFYLQSRGLGRHEAEKLLTEGFARDVVEKFNVADLEKWTLWCFADGQQRVNP